MTVFESQHRTPKRFIDTVKALLIDGSTDIAMAAKENSEAAGREAEFSAIYDNLAPVDQILLTLMAAEPLSGNYSEWQRQLVARALGLEEPLSNSTIRNAMQRLRKQELIYQVEYGVWGVEDSAFASWVREASRGPDEVDVNIPDST